MWRSARTAFTTIPTHRHSCRKPRVLKDGGRLILRDYTSSPFVLWLMNHIEMPLAHLCGHGDVKIHSCSEVRELCAAAGLKVRKLEPQKGFRLHLVAEKREPR
mgnify:CR=1 FL=1